LTLYPKIHEKIINNTRYLNILLLVYLTTLSNCKGYITLNGKATMRVVCKVHGLSLLLRVGILWRCGDGLFFEVPPLESDALLTTLHPLLENVLQTVDHFEISCLGTPFSSLEKPRNRRRQDLDCMVEVLMGFHRSTFSKPKTEFYSHLALCDFWAFQPQKGSSEARNFQVINGLQYIFEKWVERCKKCVGYERSYFENETLTAPPQSSDLE
jgi:hypothetical protein